MVNGVAIESSVAGGVASGSNHGRENKKSINSGRASSKTTSFGAVDPSVAVDRWQFNAESPPQPQSLDEFNFNGSIPMNMSTVDGGNFTWEIINLGLDEPLPQQETIDEL